MFADTARVTNVRIIIGTGEGKHLKFETQIDRTSAYKLDG